MRLVRPTWPSLLIAGLLVSAVFGQRVFLPLSIGEKQPGNFEILPALLVVVVVDDEPVVPRPVVGVLRRWRLDE